MPSNVSKTNGVGKDLTMPDDALMNHFMLHVLPEPNSGCWLWAGPEDGGEYGGLHHNGTRHRAHRLSYQLFCGDIPDRLMICHHCDTKWCVNPAHLFLGTAEDNNRDCQAKGRHIAAYGRTSQITHCVRGHPFSGHNLVIERRSNGRFRRVCRTCKNTRGLARWRRIREQHR